MNHCSPESNRFINVSESLTTSYHLLSVIVMGITLDPECLVGTEGTRSPSPMVAKSPSSKLAALSAGKDVVGVARDCWNSSALIPEHCGHWYLSLSTSHSRGTVPRVSVSIQFSSLPVPFSSMKALGVPLFFLLCFFLLSITPSLRERKILLSPR
jgi:hypothetical protein